MPVRARLAVFLAASFAVAAAFFATVGQGDDRPAAPKRFEGAKRPPGIAPADFRLRDLVRLANVDDDDAVLAEVLADLGRVDLVDLALDLADELSAGGGHVGNLLNGGRTCVLQEV